jgi:hypothetical protein
MYSAVLKKSWVENAQSDREKKERKKLRVFSRTAKTPVHSRGRLVEV